MPRRLVFGLGPGRCGTASLAAVLHVPHEAVNLPWNPDPVRLAAACKVAEEQGGGVSMTWLQYVPFLVRKYPDARFVCLRRAKDDVVASWVKNLGGLEHLDVPVVYRHGGEIRTANTFPTHLEKLPLETAVREFVNLYYQRCTEYEHQYPDQFRIFPSPHALNHYDKQEEMRRFAGRSELPFTRAEMNVMERAEPEERDRKRLQRRVHRLLYHAVVAYLRAGGSPDRDLTLADLIEYDENLLETFLQHVALTEPDADTSEIKPEDLAVIFDDLPIGSTQKDRIIRPDA